METEMTEKTSEQTAADQAAEKAAKVAEKAAEKQRKAEAKAAEKAAKDAQKAEEKAKKDAEKAAAAEAKTAAKAQAKADRAAKKAEAQAQRDANKMPEQNGVRRPKPDTLCGKAWSIFDSVSQKGGAPASIGESLEVARAQGLNDSNVRAEYARWRKFHGISGRIEAPKPVEQAKESVPA
jgi:membrane protein involved in colicin uptake